MWITFRTLLNVIELALTAIVITKNEQLKLLNPLKVHWIAKTAKIQAPEKKQKIFLSSLLIASSMVDMELLAIRNNNKTRFLLTRYNIYRHKTSYILVFIKCIENIVNIEREYRMAFPILLLAHSMGWHIFAVVCANNIPRTNKQKNEEKHRFIDSSWSNGDRPRPSERRKYETNKNFDLKFCFYCYVFPF